MKITPPTKVAEIISDAIAAMKKEKTQRQIADDAGIEHTVLSRLKNGHNIVDIPKLHALSVSMGVKPGDLLPADWFPTNKTGMDADKVKHIIKAVLVAYAESSANEGKDYATPEQLAQIIGVYLDEGEADITPSAIRTNIKLSKREPNDHSNLRLIKS